MKKVVRNLTLFAALLLLAGCGANAGEGSTPNSSTQEEADTVKPYFTGVPTNATCVAGQEYDALQGVQAFDAVDGEITDKIVVSTVPATTVNNGKFTPTQVGYYEVTYSVSDAAGNEQRAFTELTVTKALSERELVKDYSFDAGVGNWEPWMHEEIVGTKGIVAGKYQFKVDQGTGTDWHVKYAYYNYPVEGGHDYKLTISFNSSVAGNVMVCGSEKSIRVGDNELSVTRSFGVSQNFNIEFQFGKLPAPFVVNINEIKIEDSYKTVDPESVKVVKVGQYSNALEEGWTFNKDDYHCEYAVGEAVTGNVVKTANDVVVTQTGSEPDKAWAGKLIIQTKTLFDADTTYRVSATYESSVDVSGMEFGMGFWGDDFKKYNEQYGVSFSAHTPKKMVFTFKTAANATSSELDNPFVCLKMGNLPVGETMKASNFKVEKYIGEEDLDLTPASVWADPAENIEKKAQSATSITAKIVNKGAGPWTASIDGLYNNVSINAGKTYRLTMDAISTKRVEQARLMIGKDSWDPTELLDSGEGIVLEENKEKQLVAYFTAQEGQDLLKFRFKFGNADAGSEITLSNITLEEVAFLGADAVSVLKEGWAFNYDEYVSTYNPGEGSAATINVTAENAAVTVTTPAPEGMGWAAKFVIEARTPLEVGKKYHVAITMNSTVAFEGFEVGAGNWDDDFKAIGATYGVSMPASNMTFAYDYVCDEAKGDDWGFCFKMGSAPAGCVLTASNLVVEEVPNSSSSEEERFFFHPEFMETYNNTEAGCSGNIYVDEDGNLVYDITSLGHESDWYNKFFVTPIYLEAGKLYTFELKVKADCVLTGGLFLNVLNKWDVRASTNFELTTEFQTITLTLEPLAADMGFELLFQGLNENTVDHAKIIFESIKIYSQTYLD